MTSINSSEFSVVGFFSLGKSPEVFSCEHCGTDIRNIVILQSEHGRIKVGTTCAMQLTAGTPAHTNVYKLQARYERARRQWKSNKPARRDGETQDSYIVRRMAEMDNAMRAFKEYSVIRVNKFEFKGGMGSWIFPYSRKVVDRAAKLGIVLTEAQLRERYQDRIAKKYNANPFDFVNPVWNVRKI